MPIPQENQLKILMKAVLHFYNGKLEEKFIREHRLSSIMRQSLKNHEFIVVLSA